MSKNRNRGVLSECDLASVTRLNALQVHERLVRLARAHHRVESALAFYLLEVEMRALFLEYGHVSTVDYARECLGLEDRKTRALLRLAIRLQSLPKMKEAFSKGDLHYTKAREVVRVATPENEEQWVEKCKTLSNRQIEREVKNELPPERKRVLVLVLDESRIAAWERAREGMERLAGKTLTDIEVHDLMCAEALCTYDTTPPLGDESDPMGGYVAEVIERDGFRCTRPGCSNRSCLTGSHVVPRSQGGTDDPSNLHTACMACHRAIETGRLRVSGRAPDQLTWEGPFGVIERPFASGPKPAPAKVYTPRGSSAASKVREPRPSYELCVPRGTKRDRRGRRPRGDLISYIPSHVGRTKPSSSKSEWLAKRVPRGTDAGRLERTLLCFIHEMPTSHTIKGVFVEKSAGTLAACAQSSR